MKTGFRLEGQIGDVRATSTLKPLWEYTADDIAKPGVRWMTDAAPNADVLTRAGDGFDKAFTSAGKILTLAVPEIWMRVAPYREKQFIEKYSVYWYAAGSQGVDDYWRKISFYHVTVFKVRAREFAAAPRGSYHEIVMKVAANVDYKDKYGINAQ